MFDLQEMDTTEPAPGARVAAASARQDQGSKRNKKERKKYR